MYGVYNIKTKTRVAMFESATEAWTYIYSLDAPSDYDVINLISESETVSRPTFLAESA
jgi:hypothetical protein